MPNLGSLEPRLLIRAARIRVRLKDVAACWCSDKGMVISGHQEYQLDPFLHIRAQEKDDMPYALGWGYIHGRYHYCCQCSSAGIAISVVYQKISTGFLFSLWGTGEIPIAHVDWSILERYHCCH